MNGDNMEKNRIMWLIGVIFMIMPIVIIFILYKENKNFLYNNIYIVFIPLIIGLLFMTYGLFTDKKFLSSLRTYGDERTRKLTYKSRSYTLSITIIFLAILMGLSHYEIMNLELKDIWWPVLIQIAITSLILRYYFNKKKDL